MPRPKTTATIFIESFLHKHGVDSNYDDFFNSEDYRTFVSQEKNLIEAATFSAVKSRIKKSNFETDFPATQRFTMVSEPVKKIVAQNSFSYDEETEKFIPAVDNNFILDAKSEGFIDLVHQRSCMENVNVRLVGPAGCGKTSFATHYAAILKLPCLIMDCANVREPRDWFGYRTLDPVTKEIVWHESLFIQMIETPGAVIILDELNRVSPLVVNTLIPLLDHRRSTYLEEAGRTISCAEQVTFWAAINEGNQFTGTIALDEAVADRFGLVMECNFLTPEDESKVLFMRSDLDLSSCSRLVDVANQVRSKCQQHGVDTFSKPISTRMLVEASKALKLGGLPTFHYTLLNHFSSFGGPSSERSSLAKLLMGKFGNF